MLVTWRSTAATVTVSSRAIPTLERPSAIWASTCRSRGVRLSRGLFSVCGPPAARPRRGRAPTRLRRPGAPHRRTCADRPLFLQQVADALSAVGDQVEHITVLKELR